MADADNNKLLQELDALSQNLYQAHTARRTASLALPRSSDAAEVNPDDPSVLTETAAIDYRHRTRRTSMSPCRSRSKLDSTTDTPPSTKSRHQPAINVYVTPDEEKKGLWSWKPLRALSHISMNRLTILFSVEVVAIETLPASMNGLRLSVTVRKKENKDGAVQTMPARVLQGVADFEETLFIRSHVYCSGGGSSRKALKFEPRPFLVFATAIEAPELDLGRTTVDLSLLVMEWMERNMEGSRIRQWDAVFGLSGKGSGGQLVLKLGFQIMEDGGIGIYNQPTEASGGERSKGMARKHSKSSFSISSPKAARPGPSSTPSQENLVLQLQRIEEFNLDDDPPLPPPSKHETEAKAKELDIPEYEVEDKGVEGPLEREEAVEVESNPTTDEASVSSEVVKEVVLDSAHLVCLTELDSIAQQIKALESMMASEDEGEGREDVSNLYSAPLKENTQQLDADEESVTREFLQLLELEGDQEDAKYKAFSNSLKSPDAESPNYETKSYLSDLGKGLGPVVQTRDGGYLASMNPLETEISRKELPKLAMQISRPIVVPDKNSTTGCELFQELAAKGLEELGAKLLTLTAMDELVGKTPEQIAFEGIASAIVSGRKKEMATSAAAKSIEILKSMAAAMNGGRKERILTGIWNLKEEPLASIEEALCFSLQKLESMAVEALKVQAGVAEEEAPFAVSPISEGERGWLLNSAEPLDEWTKKGNGKVEGAILLVVVQLRDPLRRFEAVGAPLIATVKASKAGDGGMGKEERFKLASLHVGGMKLRQGRKRSYWDGERQRLTAMQWLVAYGLAKAGRKVKLGEVGGVGKDAIWSLSSRVIADMWLKSTRNPDVRLLEQ